MSSKFYLLLVLVSAALAYWGITQLTGIAAALTYLVGFALAVLCSLLALDSLGRND